MTCPASVHLIEQLRDIVPEKDSEYSAEGVYAHTILAERLTLLYHSSEPPHKLPIIKKDQWAIEVMEDYIMEQMEFKPSAKLYIEQYVKPYDERDDMGGTADAIIVSDNEIEIIDYKHGRGVFVPVKDNSQLIIYALGVLNKMDISNLSGFKREQKLCRDKTGHVWLDTVFIPTPKKIKITIIQPRHGQAREASPKGDGVMSCTYSLEEMFKFKVKIRQAIAKVDIVDEKFKNPTYTMEKAYIDGHINTGDPKHKRTGKDPCKFCDFKTMCPAIYSSAESAKRAAAEFAEFDANSIDLIKDDNNWVSLEAPGMIDRFIWLYDQAQYFKSLASDTEKTMLKLLQIAEQDQNPRLNQLLASHFELEDKKGNRAWTKSDKVVMARMLHEFGLTKLQCYDLKINSPAKMETYLNASQKRALRESDLIGRPTTGVRIVRKENKSI